VVEARMTGASFHRIDDSGAGASTFGMAARGLFCTAGAATAATGRGSTLAVDLLEAVFETAGHKGVMELLTIRNKKRIERFRERFEGKAIGQRVEEISRIFSEDGYMTEWEAIEGGNYIIYQRHCAVHDMANQFRQLCSMEPMMIQELLGVKVTREKYILRNDPLCAYVVHVNEAADLNAFELPES